MTTTLPMPRPLLEELGEARQWLQLLRTKPDALTDAELLAALRRWCDRHGLETLDEETFGTVAAVRGGAGRP